MPSIHSRKAPPAVETKVNWSVTLAWLSAATVSPPPATAINRPAFARAPAARAAAKNFVTRALGVEPIVEVEITEIPVVKDDLFLLCSDGLSDMVEDDDIQLTATTFGANLETLAKQLVLLGNENGGRDNISVVLARVLDQFPARRGMMDRLLGLFG